jgi:aspartate/methionine/tyrosine aminotransferase
MTDMLLAKPKLPADWIDLSVGEAVLVRQALSKHFEFPFYKLTDHEYEYPDPSGYKPLVGLLEEQYKAPVVITNGAKQGLGAIAYALHKMGKRSIGLGPIYWCLLPPLMSAHGLTCRFDDYISADAQLLVLPNNPDNSIAGLEVESRLASMGLPLIHDAVYYNHIYLPAEYPLTQIGDVQLYSASKAMGLSGLRVGWAVCPNSDFYALVREYVEMMTVGVSIASQKAVYGLLRAMQECPEKQLAFEADARHALKEAKKTLVKINPTVLDIPKDLPEQPGMFAFVQCKRPDVLKAAKISVPDGKHFGKEGHIRINLAVEAKTLQEAVERINRCAE